MPLIVLEGIDGCGKTTQTELLAEALIAAGKPVRRLREPGGTRLGEQIRSLLLDPATQACPVAELFGYLTARAQLCSEILAPALAAGDWVLMDRFWPSTVAYQAYGLGLNPAPVLSAIALALGGIRMDYGFWLDVDPEEAQRRRRASRAADDRIEARGLEYQRKVAAGYAALTRDGILTRIDANGSPEAMAKAIHARVFV